MNQIQARSENYTKVIPQSKTPNGDALIAVLKNPNRTPQDIVLVIQKIHSISNTETLTKVLGELETQINGDGTAKWTVPILKVIAYSNVAVESIFSTTIRLAEKVADPVDLAYIINGIFHITLHMSPALLQLAVDTIGRQDAFREFSGTLELIAHAPKADGTLLQNIFLAASRQDRDARLSIYIAILENSAVLDDTMQQMLSAASTDIHMLDLVIRCIARVKTASESTKLVAVQATKYILQPDMRAKTLEDFTSAQPLSENILLEVIAACVGTDISERWASDLTRAVVANNGSTFTVSLGLLDLLGQLKNVGTVTRKLHFGIAETVAKSQQVTEPVLDRIIKIAETFGGEKGIRLLGLVSRAPTVCQRLFEQIIAYALTLPPGDCANLLMEIACSKRGNATVSVCVLNAAKGDLKRFPSIACRVISSGKVDEKVLELALDSASLLPSGDAQRVLHLIVKSKALTLPLLERVLSSASKLAPEDGEVVIGEICTLAISTEDILKKTVDLSVTFSVVGVATVMCGVYRDPTTRVFRSHEFCMQLDQIPSVLEFRQAALASLPSNWPALMRPVMQPVSLSYYPNGNLGEEEVEVFAEALEQMVVKIISVAANQTDPVKSQFTEVFKNVFHHLSQITTGNKSGRPFLKSYQKIMSFDIRKTAYALPAVLDNFAKPMNRLGEILGDNQLDQLGISWNDLQELKFFYQTLNDAWNTLKYFNNGYSIGFWDESREDAMRLGEYLNCCLSQGGNYGGFHYDEMPKRIISACAFQIVIQDVQEKPQAGIWCFVAKDEESNIILAVDFTDSSRDILNIPSLAKSFVGMLHRRLKQLGQQAGLDAYVGCQPYDGPRQRLQLHPNSAFTQRRFEVLLQFPEKGHYLDNLNKSAAKFVKL